MTKKLFSKFFRYLNVLIKLIKFRITLNIVLTTFIGFYIGETYLGQFSTDSHLLFSTLFSTALICAGVCCLNHVVEWKEDAKMDRTKNRPIPSGQISILSASLFGTTLLIAGLYWMYQSISLGLTLVAMLTSILYLFVYTPLKKISWWNTSVGAIPGALPIMGGWYAARGYLGLEGWVLFLILFFWQHPHFYAIAWICRKDYEIAGYKMISLNDPKGQKTFTHALFHAVILSIITMALVQTEFSAGRVYLFGIIALNLWFLFQVWSLYRHRTTQDAKKVIIASVIYLCGMFALFFVDQQIPL